MAQTSVCIRMDSELKDQFEHFCQEMGITMTAAFNMFAKKSVRENRIPFEVGIEKPNRETLKAIAEIEKMIQTGSGKKYNSIKELFEDLEQ